jgi:hypothetical protein
MVWKARNAVSKKYISEFKRMSIFTKDVIDLLYRTAIMIEFTLLDSDIDEPLSNSLVSNYEEACQLIKKEKLVQEYQPYCQELMGKTYEMGWELYDDLHYYFTASLTGSTG